MALGAQSRLGPVRLTTNRIWQQPNNDFPPTITGPDEGLSPVRPGLCRGARTVHSLTKGGTPMNVLIAVDDDAESQAALEFADRLVGPDDEVSVLHVANEITPYIAGPFGGYVMVPASQIAMDEIDEQADAVVERDAASISSADAKELVDYGDPAERICATAIEHNIELIIIGSHERGAFGRFLHGSVSEDVMRNAPCSVLVVKSTPSANPAS